MGLLLQCKATHNCMLICFFFILIIFIFSLIISSRHYLHGLRKETKLTGVRINVTFRTIYRIHHMPCALRVVVCCVFVSFVCRLSRLSRLSSCCAFVSFVVCCLVCCLVCCAVLILFVKYLFLFKAHLYAAKTSRPLKAPRIYRKPNRGVFLYLSYTHIINIFKSPNILLEISKEFQQAQFILDGSQFGRLECTVCQWEPSQAIILKVLIYWEKKRERGEKWKKKGVNTSDYLH
jgi:hypothetical protein